MKKEILLCLIIVGLTSFRSDIEIEDNSTKVVLIGVSRYNHVISWKYTDDDAYRLYAFHKSHLVPDDNISILIDEDATNKNIIEKVTNEASSCTSNDNFFFYFGGHSDSTGIWGIDAQPNNIVKYQRLGKILQDCKAKHKLLIINAAYNEDAAKAFDKNTTVFFAGSEGETTPEHDDLKQTIFGHFLIRGLKGAADNDENKVVTLKELETYVYDNVRHYTDNQQNPKLINFVGFEWEVK